MKLARVGQGVLVIGLLGACAAPPPDSERDQSIVITRHGHDTDFAKYRTFYLRPEIRTLDDSGELTPVDSVKAQPLLDATTNNLLERGFTSADKDTADLAVEMIYTEHISSEYWCYYFWDPYYWGYPYYPYYGCDATVWKSNMLSTIMSDLTEVHAASGQSARAPGAGGDGAAEQVPGIWFSGIYGIAIDGKQAIDGINQAFAQSPYLAPVP